MITLFQFLGFFAFLSSVKGHGNMVKPAVWADYDNRAWWYDENGDNYKIGCGVLEGMPTDTDYTIATGEPIDCLHMWFNNHAYIPGEKNNSWLHGAAGDEVYTFKWLPKSTHEPSLDGTRISSYI